MVSYKNRAVNEISTADIHHARECAYIPDTVDDLAYLMKYNMYRAENPELEIEEYRLKDVKPIWNKLAEKYGKNSYKYIIMYLYFYIGFSYRQINQVLHLSHVACYKHVTQAIAYLKKEFANEPGNNNNNESGTEQLSD